MTQRRQRRHDGWNHFEDMFESSAKIARDTPGHVVIKRINIRTEPAKEPPWKFQPSASNKCDNLSLSLLAVMLASFMAPTLRSSFKSLYFLMLFLRFSGFRCTFIAFCSLFPSPSPFLFVQLSVFFFVIILKDRVERIIRGRTAYCLHGLGKVKGER